MSIEKKTIFWIKFPYYLGIAADTLWAIALFFPQIFSFISGRLDIEYDFQTRIIMAIGGILMTGWTCLLIWGVQKPIERKSVILLTAFPVVFGLSIVAIISYMAGNTFNLWIIIKCIILFITMIWSYILAGKIEKRLT